MDLSAIISNKYSYLSELEVEVLLNKAKSICVEQLYPSDLSVNYLNFDWGNPRFENWLLDCVDELIERQGISSVTAYKENGMSWTFDRAGVSQTLLDRLKPIARAVGGIR